jgi:SRSO17 transposase
VNGHFEALILQRYVPLEFWGGLVQTDASFLCRRLGMDAAQIRSLKPRLKAYLKPFADCFSRSDTRSHLSTYVAGQLSDLPRKNCEPIADAANMPPRTLQQFLSLLEWDHGLMKTKLQQLVAREHASSHSVGIIDETGCPKKGEKTPGVQTQWCGATGKKDNCVVTVHLGYAVDDFHCLLDSELFLPESWSNDRARCRAAKIPDEMVHRPKPQIALELYDRARSNGVAFEWLTFDELYSHSRKFLAGLRSRGQKYVGEVPVNFLGWSQPPQVTERTYRKRAHCGRVRKTPRCMQDEPAPKTVQEHLKSSPELRDQRWQKFRVKDGEKGPQVWEVKHVWFYPHDGDGLPLEPVHLIVARNVLAPQQIKYFIAHAPQETRLEAMLLVGFARWHVERCFQDEKTELGFDHFEGRTYVGLMRHQLITAVTHLFLARVHLEWREKKSTPDRVPGAHGLVRLGAILVAAEACRRQATRESRQDHHQNATPPCRDSQESPKANYPPPPLPECPHQPPATVSLGERELAL